MTNDHVSRKTKPIRLFPHYLWSHVLGMDIRVCILKALYGVWPKVIKHVNCEWCSQYMGPVLHPYGCVNRGHKLHGLYTNLTHYSSYVDALKVITHLLSMIMVIRLFAGYILANNVGYYFYILTRGKWLFFRTCVWIYHLTQLYWLTWFVSLPS